MRLLDGALFVGIMQVTQSRRLGWLKRRKTPRDPPCGVTTPSIRARRPSAIPPSPPATPFSTPAMWSRSSTRCCAACARMAKRSAVLPPPSAFSRPSFYQTEAVFDAEGLPGLVPQRPGPKRAHKLSDEVVDRLERVLEAEPALNSAQLAQRLEDELGLRVHRRSIERALSRRTKTRATRRR